MQLKTLAPNVMVEDLNRTFRAKANKLVIVQDLNTTFYGMREFTIRDCNGYLLTFAEPVQ